jgi:hypothetical protein
VRLQDVIRYDAAPPAVFEMLVDPAFQERKCEATGALSWVVGVDRTGDGSAVITTRRSMPTDQLPELVRGLAGRGLEIVEVDEWGPPATDGARAGRVTVRIEGAPVRVTGALRLSGEGRGSRQEIDAELTASVPLIGGRIEKAAEPAMRAAIRVEGRTGAAWLSGG